MLPRHILFNEAQALALDADDVFSASMLRIAMTELAGVDEENIAKDEKGRKLSRAMVWS